MADLYGGYRWRGAEYRSTREFEAAMRLVYPDIESWVYAPNYVKTRHRDSGMRLFTRVFQGTNSNVADDPVSVISAQQMRDRLLERLKS